MPWPRRFWLCPAARVSFTTSISGRCCAKSSLAVVVRRHRDCNALCPVRAVQEFALVPDSVGWAPREGYLVPQVGSDGSKGRSPWLAQDMSTTLRKFMSKAGLAEGRDYSMHSFRVGGAVSQTLACTAIDALMNSVGWKTRGIAQRYVGPQPSVPGVLTQSGGPEVETRYAAAISLPLEAGFEDEFAAFK